MLYYINVIIMRLKDKEYFNDRIYFFTNKELKEKALDLAAKNNIPLYFLVDEALREKLIKEEIKVTTRPKRPALI